MPLLSSKPGPRGWKHAFTFSAALCALAALGCAPRAERPNFVLCMSDDQGWGDVGYRGHAVLKTPTIDTMAAEGLRLERFYAAAPVCSPTRGSVLTGRHPNRFGCFSFGGTLQPEEFTLAEVLRDAGYATGHFGKWHLGSIHQDSPYSPGANGFDEWLSNPNFFDHDPWMSSKGQIERSTGEGSRVVVDAALEFIRSAVRRAQPFLAVVWFSAPHEPYEARAEDRRPYADQPEELANYYGEIAGLDSALGHLRAELRALGIASATLLWFTSDNGAAPLGSNGGLSGAKGSLDEGGLRVPCVLEWPTRITAGTLCEIPCGTIDIYPTLLELAGVAPPRGQGVLDGVSLVALLAGNEVPRSRPLGFWVRSSEGALVAGRKSLRAQLAGDEEWADIASAGPAPHMAEDERSGLVAWVDGKFKLKGRVGPGGVGAYSLIDLEQDPQELDDLAERQPERTERMKLELWDWQRSVVRSLNRADDGYSRR